MNSNSSDPNYANKYGHICWLEIPVADSARAMAFYRTVFGWDCKDQSMPSPLQGVKEINFFNSGSLNGAFLTVASENLIGTSATAAGKQGVVASYAVASIDDALAKIEKAGGKIVVPKTIIRNGMGAFARFEDPDGNLQGVYDQSRA